MIVNERNDQIQEVFNHSRPESDHVFWGSPLRPIMFSVDTSALQTTGSPREVESSSNGKQNENSHGSDVREQCECTWSHTDPEISRSVSDDRDDDTSRVIEKSKMADAAIVGGIFDTVTTKED
jgi:hypothetical protein